MSARCYRDRFGIPHLKGEGLLELAWAQGYECARSRCWQLDYQHRRGLGQTAVLFGAPALDWDRLARRTELVPLAERILEGLPEETQQFLTAYVDGVNAGFDSLPAGRKSAEHAELGVDPLPWQPWSPIVGFVAIHLLFGRLGDKLWGSLIEGRLGRAGIDLFNSEGPAELAGSNAMVLGGELTATGSPLIAGDSHRTFEDPNPYYQVHLACPEFDVIGFAFPGVPGVVHFGHTGHVAWAVTNAGADTHDVFLERLAESVPRRTELIEVRTEKGIETVEVEVVRGETGPVIFDSEEADLPSGTAYTAATAPLQSVAVGFEAILPLLRARTVADVEAAFADWVEPANNVVIADSAGALTHRVIGQVPERDHANWDVPGDASDPAARWQGYLTDLPRHDLSRADRFVTANDRANSDYDRIGGDFAGPWRADRIRELVDASLARGDKHDADSLLGVLLDDLQTEGDTLLSAIADLVGLSPDAAALQAELAAWDRHMTTDSRTAARYIAIRDALARRIAAEPTFDGLRDRDVFGSVFGAWCDLTGRLALCLPAFLSRSDLAGIEVEPLLADAVEQVAVAGIDTPWGERHTFYPWHAFALNDREWDSSIPETPLPSDRRCVRAVAAAVGSGAAAFGSVTRYVWDLSDRDNSRWAVPLGASGDPESPHHHDQLPLWAGSELAPVVTDFARLELEAEWVPRLRHHT
jgi:penicillin G amidase